MRAFSATNKYYLLKGGLIATVLFVAFFYYAAKDPITPQTLEDRWSLYTSLRHQLLTKLTRSDKPIYGKQTIPLLQLHFSPTDSAHFADLPFLSDGDTQDFEAYQTANKQKSVTLEFAGSRMEALVKAHGMESNSHRSPPFLSLTVKLPPDQTVLGSSHFRLLVHRRLKSHPQMMQLMAEVFDLAMRENPLVRVQINEWEEHVFYFEDRLDSDHAHKAGYPHWRIHGNSANKSLIYTGINDTSLLRFWLDSAQALEPYSEALKAKLAARYSALNNALIEQDSERLLTFFDRNYLLRYETARFIGGMPGHGSAPNNLHVFIDTTSLLFYPWFTRADNLSKLLPNDSIEDQMNNYSFTRKKLAVEWQLMNRLMAENDSLRLAKYRLAYQFIKENEPTFQYAVQAKVNTYERLFFPDWVASVDGLTHLEPLPYFDQNLHTIKAYIEGGTPQLVLTPDSNSLSIQLTPNSVAPIQLSQFKIRGLPASSTTAGLLLQITEIQADTIIQWLDSAVYLPCSKGVTELGNTLATIPLYDKLDYQSMREPGTYLLSVGALDYGNLNLRNVRVSYTFVNAISGKEVARGSL